VPEPLQTATFVGRSDGARFVPSEPGRFAGWLARHKGRALTLTIEPERRRRSIPQNERYWALLVPAYQEWAGEPDKLQAHEDLLSLHNRADKLLPTGEVVKVVRRSKTLTVEEFHDFMQRVEVWLAQNGVELPEWGA
jgi:hypothetical protein